MSLLLLLLILILPLLLLSLGGVLLWRTRQHQHAFGMLAGKRIYRDTKQHPGETLYAKTLPLCGRPDHLLKTGKMILPVEVKTGETPPSPWLNHTMQVMAYCLLVQEHYGVRPTGGVLRYPNKEFKLAYTKEAEASVRSVVKELLLARKLGTEFSCTHPAHKQPHLR